MQFNGPTRNATPSDSESTHFSFVFIAGERGDVTVTLSSGDLHTITNAPNNTWFPVGGARKLMATGTSATDIFVS